MKEMCKLLIPYKCKICNSLLYFLDCNNMLIDYNNLYSKFNYSADLKDYISKRRVKYIKCINCNKEFIIDFSNTWPEQLMNKFLLDKFIS